MPRRDDLFVWLVHSEDVQLDPDADTNSRSKTGAMHPHSAFLCEEAARVKRMQLEHQALPGRNVRLFGFWDVSPDAFISLFGSTETYPIIPEEASLDEVRLFVESYGGFFGVQHVKIGDHLAASDQDRASSLRLMAKALGVKLDGFT